MAFTQTSLLTGPLLAQIGLTPERAALQAAWERAFGQWGLHVEPLSLHGGELVLGVKSSVHFQEVTLRRREIVRTLNDAVGAPVVQRVTVRRAT